MKCSVTPLWLATISNNGVWKNRFHLIEWFGWCDSRNPWQFVHLCHLDGITWFLTVFLLYPVEKEPSQNMILLNDECAHWSVVIRNTVRCFMISYPSHQFWSLYFKRCIVSMLIIWLRVKSLIETSLNIVLFVQFQTVLIFSIKDSFNLVSSFITNSCSSNVNIPMCIQH